MKILAVIPVRGGSKGVPGKNIKLLGNKPLIQYTLEAARQSELLTQVVVSTDSEEISSCVKSLGNEVPFMRPASLALDTTPTLPVIQHALQFYETQGLHFDAACILQATTPFRVPGFIDKAITRFIESQCDALISVLPVPAEYNPHWVFEPQHGGLLKVATGDSTIISRRQELPKAFYRDGCIYITKRDVIMNRHSLYGETLSYIESDPIWHVNIDTQEDWDRAEKMVKLI